jgi:hypothetical protein
MAWTNSSSLAFAQLSRRQLVGGLFAKKTSPRGKDHALLARPRPDAGEIYNLYELGPKHVSTTRHGNARCFREGVCDGIQGERTATRVSGTQPVDVRLRGAGRNKNLRRMKL